MVSLNSYLVTWDLISLDNYVAALWDVLGVLAMKILRYCTLCSLNSHNVYERE